MDPYAAQPEWFEICRLDQMETIAIDPGDKDLVTGVRRGDSKEEPDTFRQVLLIP